MRLTTFISVALVGVVAITGAPTRRQASQINISAEVVATAGGGVPNIPPPSSLSKSTLNDIQVANFLENLESAFFQAAVTNITAWGTTGFPDDTLDIIRHVAAQEQVHVATFEDILTHFNTPVIPPCQYQFPATNTASFLKLAQIITSVGIGAVINLAAATSITDPALIQNLASTVTNEARQDAFFRQAALGLVPNPTPQDTQISAIWALNLALPFVVPNSCPLFPEVPIFPAMTVIAPTGNSTGDNGSITFSTTAEVSGNLSIAWINQANLPVFTPVARTLMAGQLTSSIPPGMGGMAFAALVNQTTAKDVTALTLMTLAGPAFVQIS
ncbi:hypothetical protein MMC17_006850 [Xylographa soralifera]|nr:hypothetical protein [Xylographa soralifera]